MRINTKRGQVTVFIIIALVIVAAVVIYVVVKQPAQETKLSARFQQIENYYLGCLEELGNEGVVLLRDKGGYIEEPEFVSGTPLEPLSSKMNFFGFSIPYWLYTKEDTIKSQVPTKEIMEKQLGDFILERLGQCNFDSFTAEGYVINRRNPSVSVKIQENSVDVELEEDTLYTFGEESVKLDKHKTKIKTDLGKMYKEAVDIYNRELEKMFLENYAVDVLRLYAPVDGVELTCSPLIWKENEIYNKIKRALDINVPEIKLLNSGESYDKIRGDSEKYFTQKISSGGFDVKFMYSPSWITRLDIEPSDSGLLIAEPVGNQEGLGLLGFCYVPYHFVYDLDFPVLVQVFSGNEIFQFPLQVIIKSNKPRKALPTANEDFIKTDICKYKVKDIEVYTFNSRLQPVEAEISFKCLSSGCGLGQTKISEDGFDAVLKTKAPQCVNGFIVAKDLNGEYETSKYQISTNKEDVANILLEKLYEVDLDLETAEGDALKETALIQFRSSDGKVKTVAWPDQKKVKLTEGSYNITVYSYKNTSITIPETITTKCIDMPRPGFAGMLGIGGTEEKCFKIKIPEQKLSSALFAGGTATTYLSESELMSAKKLILFVTEFKTPKSLEELQDSYNLLENTKLIINLV